MNAVRLLPLALAALAAACTVYVKPPFTGESTPLHPPEDAWARMLKQHVDAQGRVNFHALAQDRADLDRWVVWVVERNPDAWANLFPTPAHVLAHHLNAYNALAIYNLLDLGAPESLSRMARRAYLDKRKQFVGGQPLSLIEYRERIVMGTGDPRVLFALDSVLGGDPRLPREPFRAAVLDAQLDRAARGFFADPRNLAVDARRRTITFAALMEQHQGAFLRVAPSLPEYASRFLDTPLPRDYAVTFADFDWTVRHAPR